MYCCCRHVECVEMFYMIYFVFCRALVCISHGFGEHMSRYDNLGSHLAANGVLVFGHDHGEKVSSNYMYVASL